MTFVALETCLKFVTLQGDSGVNPDLGTVLGGGIWFLAGF